MWKFGKGFMTGAALAFGLWTVMDPSRKKQYKKLKKKTNAVLNSFNDMIDDIFDN